MRIDKWLKVSRLIKRRTVAQMACDQGRVFVNDRPVKPAHDIKAGEKLHIEFGPRALTVEVVTVPAGAVPAQSASTLYKVLEDVRRQRNDDQDLDELDALDDF
jgi:ribosomal 50S subunit-recycling heat shock protein